jgi:hypothetical protein
VKRWVEWFTRREALRALTATRLSADAEQWLARARAAAELADRARAQDLPSLPLVVEAIHFALAARDKTLHPTLAEQWEAATEPLPGEPEELERLRALLTQSPLTEDAADALRAQKLARALITALELESEPLIRTRYQRLSRILALGSGVVLLLSVLAYWMSERSRGPDLAVGKAWRTSSMAPGCPLGESRMCFGYRTDIFFHTKNESNPWLLVDLGKLETFSQALIVNRSDCCRDAANPLVLEVSDDGVNFRRVSGRTKKFSRILLKFQPQTARYVRIRADKQTALHLERVSIYR